MSGKAMSSFLTKQHGWMVAISIALLPAMLSSRVLNDRVNLALHKPATTSSIENDEHAAAQANDGNADTCWRADDEPEGGPEWWQVDLQQSFDLTSGEIVWPYDGMNYRSKVEGSADGKTWQLLSDQSQTKSRSRTQKIVFEHARSIRYVKITVTGFDDGCWASLSEVRLFGSH